MSQANSKVASEDSQFASAVAEYQARRNAGEFIDREAFILIYPALADRLRSHWQQEDLASTRISMLNGETPEVTGSELQVVSDTSKCSQLTGPTETTAIPKSFGRYEVIRQIGQGAMGAVYLANDTQLHRQVALKVPKFLVAEGPEILERFYREARSAATLRHPNICPVYDVGEINGQHFISMAYIEGRPLRDFAKSSKRHALKQIAVTIRKLALALAEAHAHGIIHRDLKPANIIVDMKNEPVVMDFGLARRLTGEDGQTTASGVIVGTPAYMSPEQAQADSQQVGPGSDIYSLGVIMYELLAGRVPFQGNLMSILRQIAVDEPKPPTAWRADIDPGLEAICLRMIAKDTSVRFTSAKDVAECLGEWIRSAPSRPVISLSDAVTDSVSAAEEQNPITIFVASTTAVGAPVKPRRLARNRHELLFAGGVVSLVIGTIWAVTYWSQPEATVDHENSGVVSVKSNPDLDAAEAETVRQNSSVVPNNSLTSEAPNTRLPVKTQDFAVSFPILQSHAIMPPLDLDPDGPLTVECRVRGFTGTKQEQIFLIMIGSLHLKLMHPNDKPAWTTIGGRTENPSTSFRLIAPWPESPRPPGDTHIAFVCDSSVKLYINGKLRDSRRKNGYQFKSVDQWSIGQGGNWDGWIDEVRISRVARYRSDFVPEKRLNSDDDTLALYHFDEGRYTVLTDSSKNGAHGRLVRSTWVAADGTPAQKSVPVNETAPVVPAEVVVVDRGLKFDGIDDYLVIPSLTLKRHEAVTMEGFVRCDRNDRFMQIAGLHGLGAAFVLTTFGRNLNAGAYIDREDGEFRIQPEAIRPGQRFHVAATWDGKITRLFRDGIECRNKFPGQRHDGMLPQHGCVLGDTAVRNGDTFLPADFGYFEGTIDGFRLSQGLRYQNNFEPPRLLEGDKYTIALYHFDEGNGDVIHDATSNGHHGKIYGGAAWVSTLKTDSGP